MAGIHSADGDHVLGYGRATRERSAGECDWGSGGGKWVWRPQQGHLVGVPDEAGEEEELEEAMVCPHEWSSHVLEVSYGQLCPLSLIVIVLMRVPTRRTPRFIDKSPSPTSSMRSNTTPHNPSPQPAALPPRVPLHLPRARSYRPRRWTMGNATTSIASRSSRRNERTSSVPRRRRTRSAGSLPCSVSSRARREEVPSSRLRRRARRYGRASRWERISSVQVSSRRDRSRPPRRRVREGRWWVMGGSGQ